MGLCGTRKTSRSDTEAGTGELSVPKHTQMTTRGKVLLVENLLIDCYLLLQEVRDLKGNLSLELQAARDDRRAQASEWTEFMQEMREVLHQIRAKNLIEAKLLNLIKGKENVGEHQTI